MKKLFALFLFVVMSMVLIASSAFAQATVVNFSPNVFTAYLLPHQPLTGSVYMTSDSPDDWVIMNYYYNFQSFLSECPTEIHAWPFTFSCGVPTVVDTIEGYYYEHWRDLGQLCDRRYAFLNTFEIQNEMPPGASGTIVANVNAYYLPADTTWSIVGHHSSDSHVLIVQSYDDVRGNVDGIIDPDSGAFTWNDVLICDSIWNNQGFSYDMTYTGPGMINAARGAGYWDISTPLDPTTMAIAEINPDHPYVRNLHYNESFTVPREGISEAPIGEAILYGTTLRVASPGAAVMAYAILPDGRVWVNASGVYGGYVTFNDVPEGLTLEQIHIRPVYVNGVQEIDPYELPALPNQVKLSTNYPNPFNPSTTIPFELTVPATVTLKVYNIRGQEVATLINNGAMEAGRHLVNFDGYNLSSGTYFCRLQAGGIVDTEKMVLLK